ncbi:MAG: HAMP domain-containing histidine kinase [Deltaproteobacteria bacterium]|nr:HAMP domain-containing histidine kinase [Deltaproteobacteria bacterium]
MQVFLRSLEAYRERALHNRLVYAASARAGLVVALWLALTMPASPGWSVSRSPIFHIVSGLAFFGYAAALFFIRRHVFLARIVLMMNAFETVVLTALVGVTGGMRSPFTLFYLLLIVATALLGNPIHTLLVGLSIIAFYGTFVVLEVSGAIRPPQPFFSVDTPLPALFENDLFLWTSAVVIVAVTAFVVALSVILARQMRQMGETLGRQGSKLEAANQTLLTSFHEMESITDRLKASLEAVDASQRVVMKTEKMASLGRLSAGTISELGSPLSAIIAEAELLLMAKALPSDAKIKETLKKILANAGRVQSLVHNMRDSIRAADSQQHEVLDINMIATRAVSLLRYEADRHNVELDADYDAGEPRILGNASQIEQVIFCLVTNGIQACAASTRRVKVTTKAEGEDVRITVLDSGDGIARDNLQKIFEPFFTTRSPQEHMGLGLYVASQIIDQHRGHILVESTRNAGSKFTVVLPRKA